MNKRIRRLGIVIFFLFILLFAQLNNVQVLQAQKLQDDPRNNRNAVRDFSSPRGNILSADGKPLATSVSTNDQYERLRQYPEGELFGNVTGFFSFTYGNDGLERQYNDQLTGKKVSLSHVGDLLTDQVRTNDVTITISTQLQQTAKDALGDKKGAVVALDPKTGAVLAMYSNPGYDPSPLSGHDFKAVEAARRSLLKDPNDPMLPRAYQQNYPPGSTFKVITSSAAYDKKPELANKSYPVERSFTPRLTQLALQNFGRESCGGRLPQLLTVSCNTGFARLGTDLGGANLAAEASSFGFNQAPPLDEPFVAKSSFPSPDFFKGRDPFLAYSAIGQADVKATPLEMALTASAIANKGTIMKPHLLKEVRNNHGDIIESGKAQPWLQATSADTAKTMTKNMENVVTNGTATAAKIPGVDVAAKTGTAQTHDNYINAWFMSFAPAEDPKIAVAVIVENQVGVSEATGGIIAAPMAKQVMQAALNGK